MNTAKTTVRIIAALALVLVLAVALFWRQLLTPQQKLRYGLTFEAAQELQADYTQHPDDKQALNHYVEALVREGNFGRAFYLMDLYGAEYTGPGADKLDELRKALSDAAQEGHYQRAKEVRTAGAGQVFKDQHLPTYQALLYLDGYHHAAVGDWHSARDLFSAIEPKKLAPPLRPYYLYFLARSYRLSSKPEDQQKVEPLYDELFKSDSSPALKARATYNLIAFLLDQKDEKSAARARKLYDALDPENEAQRWSYVKASMEFANKAWNDKDAASAWSFASAALLAAPQDQAAQPTGQLMLLIADSGGMGNVHDGLVTKWTENAVQYGYAGNILKGWPKIVKQVSTDNSSDLLQARATLLAAQGDVASLKGLTSGAQFISAPLETKAEVRFLLAKLLAAKKQWNAAIAEYQAVASLNSAHKTESLLAHYLILKEVQEPLNQPTAVDLLERIVGTNRPAAVLGPPAGKAAEELIPLLINAGQKSTAQNLADFAANDWYGDEAIDVGNSWVRYLGQSGGSSDDDDETSWTYYDLDNALRIAERPGTPDLAEGHSAPFLAAAECLAGLGLAAESDEVDQERRDYQSGGAGWIASTDPPRSQVVLFNNLRSQTEWMAKSREQYSATELLETGKVTDPALLRYILDLAYPNPHRGIVEQAAKESNVDPALIYAVMKKESNFKPAAVSAVGATGLMQLMPATAGMLARGRGLPGAPLTDPKVNIRLGAAYLSSLQSELAGKAAPPGPGEDQHDALIRAVLHCYNGGPGNYAKWRSLYPSADATLLADLLPNEENEGFGKRVWKYYLIYKWRLSQTPAAP